MLMVLAVVCMAIAFMESFGGERTQELSDVVHVSDGLSMIGFSEHYDEPYIDSPVIKTDFDGQLLWTKEYGTLVNDIGRCIAIADSGLVLLYHE